MEKRGMREKRRGEEERVPVQLYDSNVGRPGLCDGPVNGAGMKTISDLLPHFNSPPQHGHCALLAWACISVMWFSLSYYRALCPDLAVSVLSVSAYLCLSLSQTRRIPPWLPRTPHMMTFGTPLPA